MPRVDWIPRTLKFDLISVKYLGRCDAEELATFFGLPWDRQELKSCLIQTRISRMCHLDCKTVYEFSA